MTRAERREDTEETSSTPHVRDFAEFCDECADRTPHEVSIELRVENEHADQPLLSREPYRVSTCSECGRTTSTRMNNA